MNKLPIYKIKNKAIDGNRKDQRVSF